ncbi:HIT domain-containing protein [Sneathiella chungangensis]|uniref:HIT domain-containing protein n=1 Tax=Sneathiella chungangensis TaxID=1418234 RepID=A0A845MG22_9PROT|nr:HIT family protein [Sneathiella chungangensis]MZR22207.1 HIT domain-containing protein [Sneathiella chungangensis]
MFQLHPQLEKDSLPVCSLGLSRVLLANDARWPWIILVPERPGLVEITDLDDPDYARLMKEIRGATTAMQDLFAAHKMNVAALGNMVPQLHLHVIARTREDAAWPRPIWGVGEAVPYDAAAVTARIAQIRDRLEGL